MEEQALIKGTPWKALLKFALPLMAANILQQLYNTVDTLVVGNFDSQNALSAVGSCAYLIGFYLAIAMGFSLGAGVLVSQFFGAKDEDGMKRYAGSGIVLLMIMGAVVTVLAFAMNRFWLQYVLNVPDSIFDMAYQYVMIYTVGLVFQFGYNIVAAILRAIGDSKSSLYFLLTASVLNIILDLVFVAVCHWGAPGVAVATTISQIICMIVSFLYMFRKYPVFRADRKYWKLDGSVVKRILVTGIPMTIQQIIINCGFMLIQRLINSFGEVLTAAETVACRLECYMLVPMGAIGSAMATYTGQNLGAKEYKRITAGTKQAVGITVCLAAVIGTVCFIFTPGLIRLFNLQGQSAAFCTAHVRLVCADLLLYALYQPFVGLFQGVGKGSLSMILFAVELSGRVMFAYLFAYVLDMGEKSVWWNEPFAFAAIVAVAFLFYVFGRWRTALDDSAAPCRINQVSKESAESLYLRKAALKGE